MALSQTSEVRHLSKTNSGLGYGIITSISGLSLNRIWFIHRKGVRKYVRWLTNNIVVLSRMSPTVPLLQASYTIEGEIIVCDFHQGETRKPRYGQYGKRVSLPIKKLCIGDYFRTVRLY